MVDSLAACSTTEHWQWPEACHLFVDPNTDLAKLHALARKIGVKGIWFQHQHRMPHYDLNPSRRAAAVQQGAVEVDRTATAACLELWRQSSRQLLTDNSPFPFGEHKGKSIGMVPDRYLDWLRGQPWIHQWPLVLEYIERNHDIIKA